MEEAIAALEELFSTPSEIKSLYQIKQWHKKYDQLQKPPLYIHALVEFTIIYDSLGNIFDCVPFVNKAKEAIDSYNEFDSSDNILLLKWLVEYEELGVECSIVVLAIFLDFDDGGCYLKFYDYPKLYIDTREITDIILFKGLFDKYYWKEVDKYYCSQSEEFQTEVCKMDGSYLKSALIKHKLVYKI